MVVIIPLHTSRSLEAPKSRSPEVLVSGAVFLFAGASRKTFLSLEQEATTAEELLRLFSLGNAQRKVSGTKMNAESSRSHSIFSILLEVRWPLPPDSW